MEANWHLGDGELAWCLVCLSQAHHLVIGRCKKWAILALVIYLIVLLFCFRHGEMVQAPLELQPLAEVLPSSAPATATVRSKGRVPLATPSQNQKGLITKRIERGGRSGFQGGVRGVDEAVCPVCGHRWKPSPSGRVFCPHCKARERHRLLGYLLKYHRPTVPGGGASQSSSAEIVGDFSYERVLHVAPVLELGLQHLLQSRANNYTAIDIKQHLYLGVPPVTIADVRNLTLVAETGSITLLVCSHVLEHVEDPLRALHEFRRVLSSSPRAAALIMVPFLARGRSSVISGSSGNMAAAGMTDSLRDLVGHKIAHRDDANAFGDDTKMIIASVGFHVLEFRPPTDAPEEFLLPNDIVYIARPKKVKSR